MKGRSKNNAHPMFMRLWGVARFIDALIELIKNAIDWQAKSVPFRADVVVTKSSLTFTDFGRGMDSRGRDSFMSASDSSAKGKDQSGAMGTGSKRMFYSFASSLTVTTVTEEDPDKVLTWTITPEELSELIRTEGEFDITVLPKNSKNWPHATCGTILHYEFADPSSQKILRGINLARRLSNRLDLNLTEMDINVDGSHIPEKDVVGSIRIEANIPELGGDVFIHVYNPTHKSTDEALRVGYKFIGEMPCQGKDGIFRALPADIAKLVPDIYHLDEVCGFICIPAFEKYAVEDRKSFDERLVYDPAIHHFVKFLRNSAASVERALKIQHKRSANLQEATTQEVVELSERSRKLYDPDGSKTSEMSEHITNTDKVLLDDEIHDSLDDPPPSHPQPSRREYSVSLVPRRSEYELGEEIDATLKLGSDVVVHNPTWYTKQALGTVIDQSSDKLRIKLDTVGNGLIRSSDITRNHRSQAEYSVVSHRELRISAESLSVHSGKSVKLKAINKDKVEGNLCWEVDGDGSLLPEDHTNKASITFIAPKVVSTTLTKVVCWDSDSPEIRHECEITIEPETVLPIVIRDDVFAVSFWTSDSVEYAKLVTVKYQGKGNVHMLVINTSSPEYERAAAGDNFQTIFTDQLCLEYARCKEIDEGDEQSGNISLALRRIQNLASEVLAELLS